MAGLKSNIVSLATIDEAVKHLQWRWLNDKNPSPGLRDQIDALLDQRHALMVARGGELGNTADVASVVEWGPGDNGQAA